MIVCYIAICETVKLTGGVNLIFMKMKIAT